MTELIPHNPVSHQIELAKTLAPSGLLPEAFKNNPANLVYAIQYADALGVAPIHAITGISVIKGKPTASADLMAAIVRRAGHKLRVTGDDTYAEAILIRSDDSSFEYKARWDADKAKKAGLTSNPTYAKYPGAMFRARAVSEVVRMGASDAMYGLVYAPEDFGETTGTPSAEPSRETTVVSRKKKPETKSQEELQDALDSTAPTNAQTRMMWALLHKHIDEPQQRAFMADTIGHDFESSKTLTRDEVSKIIDTLTSKEN